MTVPPTSDLLSPAPAPGTAPLLHAAGLVKHLGNRRVVDHVDLTCQPGEVLGLLGPNGAGKTTALRMCYGYLTPDAGRVCIAGHDLHRQPDAARRQLGVCTQDETFDSDFTVRGNLLQTTRYYRPPRPEAGNRIDELLDTFGLTEYAHHKPDTLSGGYKRRLMIARAVVHRPRVVFLDEPTTGLDPEARVAVWQLIHTLRADGLAIVLTTHYMDEAARLADRLQVLQRGRVRATGSPAHVLGDVVGDHILLLPDHDPATPAALDHLRRHGRPPTRVLTHWHAPLDPPGLAAFVAAFPDLPYEVRPPTLDDLFLALAAEGGG